MGGQTPHTGATDAIHKVQLASAIRVVTWTEAKAAPGGTVGLEVFTEFVGNDADLNLELSDRNGKKHGTVRDKISGNHFWATIRVPAGAEKELYATAELPKHGLKLKSDPLVVLPAVEIKNLKWDRNEARRGDVVGMTADIKGVPDGTESTLTILEHDADGAHDRVTSFTVPVKQGKIESKWEYEYIEDTDEIPTKEEAAKGYNPPEYFFRITIGGVSADSGLLLFKDWVEIDLKDQAGKPIPDQDYELKLPDGTTRKGKLDANGTAREKDVPPGPYTIEFPKL